MDAIGYLAEWSSNYVRHKDAILKRITGIAVKGNIILVQYKDRSSTVMLLESLKKLNNPIRESTIVTFNTKENYQALIQKWTELVKAKTTVIMINPKSKLDEKWVIATHIHNSVCDKASFKQGLKAMYEMVEPLTETGIKELTTTVP